MTIRLEFKHREIILNSTKANINLCYTCGSCVSECPVNIHTNGLPPREIVFMANMGLLDDLLTSSRIWYCLQCGRCNLVCPMTVKPDELIQYLQNEAIIRGITSYDYFLRYRLLCSQLHRIRWHMASQGLKGQNISVLVSKWEAWLEAPVESFEGTISYNENYLKNIYKSTVDNADLKSCLTCGECTSGCPVFWGKGIFDPRWIFRMTYLGQIDSLLKSPAIWLCIGCHRCSVNCSLGIDGHRVIQNLQELAVKEGAVDKHFPDQWKKAQEAIYLQFFEKIDTLFKESGEN